MPAGTLDGLRSLSEGHTRAQIDVKLSVTAGSCPYIDAVIQLVTQPV